MRREWYLAALLGASITVAGSRFTSAVQPSASVSPVRVMQVGPGPVAGKPTVITAVALSTRAQWLASGGDDHLVRIWNMQNGKLQYSLKGHEDWVRSLSFNPDGTMLASAGDDHRLLIWNVGQDKPLHDMEHLAPVYAATFSYDGKRLAAVGFETRVRVYDVASGKLEREMQGPCKDLRSVVFSPDDKNLATVGRNGQIRTWSTDGWHMQLEIAADVMRVRTLAYSPDGKKLAAGGDGRSVKVWDAQSGELLQTLECKTAKIMSLAFCGNDLLATGGTDNLIRIWDLTQPIERGQLVGHNGSVAALACDPIAGMLVSGSFDTTIRLWQLDAAGADQTAYRLEELDRK